MNKSIILATLNARYTHAALGLRYLLANFGGLTTKTELIEFTIAMQPLDIAEQLLTKKPRIIGLAVYIWNAQETLKLIQLLKTLSPEIIIVLGGPEVSYETEQQALVALADYVITGPGETSFRELAEQLLYGHRPAQKVIEGKQIPLAQLKSPYPYYTDDDLKHRAIYVEASRGCPFKCEFCLSALDKTAWPFDLTSFLADMDTLWQRGLRQFRFVDRTFNLKIQTTIAILDFFLQRLDEQTFLHFELIPDHLPDALKERIVRFPPGSLQFEIGIQSFNPEVQTRISRKQDNQKSMDNVRWLIQESHAHLHTDLIFGLPGETLDSFAQGFDQLLALKPHEIQVGILKRLRGTPIIRHTDSFKIVYNPQPPYNILSNAQIDFAIIQQMNRFARYWDMIGNSGRFTTTLPLLLGDSPFARFWQLAEWIYQQVQQTHQIALPRLFVLIHQGASEVLQLDKATLEQALLEDYAKTGQKGQIPFITDYRKNPRILANNTGTSRNNRQLRHTD